MTLGDIVFARFPFADRPRFKLRPVLVVSEPDAQGDFTALKITSRHLDDPQRIRLAPEDFATGHLSRESAIVLGSVTRLHRDSITQRVASLTTDALKPILKRGILEATRDFSRIAHTANRPGDDPLNPQNADQLLGDPATTAAHPPPAAPYAARVFTEDEVEAAVSSTLDFWLTLGAEGEALSRELSEFLGVRDSILTNSGSSANLLAVSALTTHKLPPEQRLRPGDEVITCAAGFPTTVNPILQQGLVPVFLDNDPLTGNADLSRLEEAYQPSRTKAVMMAHTLGNPFDLATVCAFCHRHGLWLIEDNCDALGSTYTLPLEQARTIGLDHLVRIAEKGKHPRITVSEAPTTDESPATGSEPLLTAPTGTFGHLSTQSFYPPHHLTMGEGGGREHRAQQAPQDLCGKLPRLGPRLLVRERGRQYLRQAVRLATRRAARRLRSQVHLLPPRLQPQAPRHPGRHRTTAGEAPPRLHRGPPAELGVPPRRFRRP